MKSTILSYSILLVFSVIGIDNAIRLPSIPAGPYSSVIAPLYTTDSNDVIAEKLKISSLHATIDPSLVLPFITQNK